jgi:hypothetical protein
MKQQTFFEMDESFLNHFFLFFFFLERNSMDRAVLERIVFQ